VEGCDACQRNKNRIEQPAGKLMPNSIPEKPWTYILADFITMKGAKGTISLAQARDAVPGPNCMLKSLWG